MRLPHEGEGPWLPHSPPAEPTAGYRSIISPRPRAAVGQAQGPPRGLGRSSRRGKHPKHGPGTQLGRPGHYLVGMRHMDRAPKLLAELNWACWTQGRLGRPIKTPQCSQGPAVHSASALACFPLVLCRAAAPLVPCSAQRSVQRSSHSGTQAAPPPSTLPPSSNSHVSLYQRHGQL